MSNPERLQQIPVNLPSYLRRLFILFICVISLFILMMTKFILVTRSNAHYGMRPNRENASTLSRRTPYTSLHVVDWRKFLPDIGGCLPNYFLVNQSAETKVGYQSGVIGFQHLNKAGGMTVRKCLKSFPSVREILVSDMNRMELEAHAAFGTLTINSVDIFHGDYVFGLCETLLRTSTINGTRTRPCSYFTLLRDPYERVISSYLFCKGYPIDRTCGPFSARKHSIEEWALRQGSYFFYQLLQKPKYCRMGDRSTNEFSTVLADSLRASGHSGLPNQCWFLEKTILENLLSPGDREALLDYLLVNLKNTFSVIGLTDKIEQTFSLLHKVYGLPFDKCFTRVRNAGPKSKSISLYDSLRKRLLQNATAVNALKEDLALYNEGLRIFELEMKAMNRSDPWF